jgi:PKD repeat protein
MSKFTLKKCWLSLIAALIFLPAMAQETKKCGFDEAMQRLYEEYPELLKEQRELLEHNKQFVKNSSGGRSAVYIVPVVFHIMHEYGVENITDAQLMNQMDWLNKDFRKRGADTTDIIPQFKPIAGDSKIEFRLANKDPFGNCTNGINRYFSHETRNGDDNSKLNPWPRNRYLNVWIVKDISRGGVAGYAYKPVGASVPYMYLVDGIMIKHDYIGSIGTGAIGRNRTLSHEVGHYLGLDHPWGGTNNPGVACGDDGVDDTPVTMGSSNCNNILEPICSVYHNRKLFLFNDVVANSTGTTDPSVIPADSGLTATPFKAVGVSGQPKLSGMFSFSNWDEGADDGLTDFADLTGSINTSKYYEVTLKADEVRMMFLQAENKTVLDEFGYSAKLAGINFNVGRNETGVRTFAVRSSVDNFTANLPASVTPANSPNINIQPGNIFFLRNDITNFTEKCAITLSGAAYNNTDKAITFRFYAWNAEDADGTFNVDSVNFPGTHGVVENKQNIMDYSFCDKMFTTGQGLLMQGTLNSDVASRSNLWTDENLKFTGTDKDPVLCAPIADFTANSTYTCQGGEVTFSSAAWNGAVSEFNWTFQDGTPATSTAQNPKVKFSTPGWKKVTFTAKNAKGSDTKSVDKYVFVATTWSDFSGPSSETFNPNSTTSEWWQVENPNEDQKFELHTWTEDNRALGLVNVIPNPLPNYYRSLGGRRDAIVSPSYDLRFVTGASFTFKYACATRAASAQDIQETVRVFTSSDCGRSWVFRREIKGVQLANAGYHEGSFKPNKEGDWQSFSLSLPPQLMVNNLRFKIEYTAGDASNNIYFDDIRVTGTVGVDELVQENVSLLVFPNPTKNSQALSISYYSNADATITITDVLGKVVYVNKNQKGGGEHTIQVNMNELEMKAGVYIVNVSDGNTTQSRKVIVY